MGGLPYDQEYAIMSNEVAEAITNKNVTNTQLRYIISRCRGTLTDIEMINSPHLYDSAASIDIRTANDYVRAYGANTDREFHQFFRIGPGYSVGQFMRDKLLENVHGTHLTHRAIKYVLFALATISLNKEQTFGFVRKADQPRPIATIATYCHY